MHRSSLAIVAALPLAENEKPLPTLKPIPQRILTRLEKNIIKLEKIAAAAKASAA